MLISGGLNVLTAEDGHAGLEVFRQHAGQLSAVVLDLTMPRMGGDEVFVEMRRIRPEVPILMSSGYAEQDVVRRFAGKGLAGFIHKPFQRAELLDKVLGAIREAKAKS
jgi:CheY-like chemotaxis protein